MPGQYDARASESEAIFCLRSARLSSPRRSSHCLCPRSCRRLSFRCDGCQRPGRGHLARSHRGRNTSGSSFLRSHPVLQLVRFPHPLGHRRLDLVAVADLNQMRHLRLGRWRGAANLRGDDGPPQEHPELQKTPSWPHETVTGRSREHDRVVRGVSPLLAELDSCFPQPLPCLAQVLGQILRERGLGGRPAIVRSAFLYPGLAVIALVRGHRRIVANWASRPGVFPRTELRRSISAELRLRHLDGWSAGAHPLATSDPARLDG